MPISYNNADNEGHIMVALMNMGTEAVTIPQGERIAQGIFFNYLTVDDDDKIEKAVRGGGFGSTGGLYGPAAAKRAPGIADSEKPDYGRRILRKMPESAPPADRRALNRHRLQRRGLLPDPYQRRGSRRVAPVAENADGREENIGYAVGCPDALLYNPRYLNFER